MDDKERKWYQRIFSRLPKPKPVRDFSIHCHLCGHKMLFNEKDTWKRCAIRVDHHVKNKSGGTAFWTPYTETFIVCLECVKMLDEHDVDYETKEQ